jgi:hypothetical protein
MPGNFLNQLIEKLYEMKMGEKLDSIKLADLARLSQLEGRINFFWGVI